MPDAYQLVITAPAQQDLEEAYLWIRDQAPSAADRWFNGLVEAFDSLRRFPRRCGLAPENEYFDREIRQLLYGKKAGLYRLLFTIRKNEVHILHIRHAARRRLNPHDVGIFPTGEPSRLPN